MGSSLSHNNSASEEEETRRSRHRTGSSVNNKPRAGRSPSPRSVQHHPSLFAVVTPATIPPSPRDRQEPTDQLWRLLRRRDWEGALERLRFHPRDAAWRGEDDNHHGTTPLHAACQRRAPLEVLRALVAAWPAALWSTDSSGWIPLHVLLLHHGPDDEEAAVALIRAGGRAAAAASPSSAANGAALHLACRHGVGLAVLRELLWQYPQAVRIGVPCFPADLVWKQMEGQRRRRRGGTEEDDENDHCLLLLQRWNLLMAAASGRPLTEDDDRLLLLGDPHHPLFTLHEVLEFQRTCTSSPDAHFVESVYLRFYPGSAAVADPGTGRLPLHAACAPSFLQRRRNGVVDSATAEAVLRAHPAAAAARDGAGRLPLHYAALSCNGDRSLRRLVQRLVDAFPAALVTRCPLTGLLPFQLAASHHQQQQGGSLDVVYDLLRACPQLVEKSDDEE